MSDNSETLPPLEPSSSGDSPTKSINDSTLPPTPTPHSAPLSEGASSNFLDGSSSASSMGKATVGGQFGDYELLEEIARGGMGVVYKARQISLNRLAALKMILAGQLAGEEEVRRFHREAEAAACLDHPHITPIFEVGELDGQHFFSMGYVPGCSLADRIAEGPLTSREAAALLKKIAEAVSYAHQRGVVHRDLKPANILLDQAGEPKITDFGVAKKVETDAALTSTGQILGTPAFMPPEQAAGKLHEVGPASDIYSLGAVLYAMLTGRPPFQAAHVMDTLIQVMDQLPAPVRLLNAAVDRDLETICMKCLEKEPRRRYESAQTLADDLARYLDGESISVKSVNLLDRVARTLERSKHDVEFRAWSHVFLLFAMIVLVAEIGIYIHTLGGPPYPTHWAILIRAIEFGAMGALLVRQYQRSSRSANHAHRLMWSLWIGFFIACHIVVAAGYLMAANSIPLNVITTYPTFCALSGLAFFVLGSSYWGYCYLFGAIFFLLSLLTAVFLPYAPLMFGGAWAAVLACIALRLRRLYKPEGQVKSCEK